LDLSALKRKQLLPLDAQRAFTKVSGQARGRRICLAVLRRRIPVCCRRLAGRSFRSRIVSFCRQDAGSTLF